MMRLQQLIDQIAQSQEQVKVVIAEQEEEKKEEEEPANPSDFFVKKIMINTCVGSNNDINELEEEDKIADETLNCSNSCLDAPKERRCRKDARNFDGVDLDDLCTICYTTELGSDPCTRLSCGHVFHTECIVQLL